MIHENINTELAHVNQIITNVDQNCRRNDGTFNHEAMMYLPDLLAIAQEYYGVMNLLQESRNSTKAIISPENVTVFETECKSDAPEHS